MKKKMIRRGFSTVLLLACFAAFNSQTVMPRPEKINIQIPDLKENQYGLIIDGVILPAHETGIKVRDQYYISLDVIQSYISDDLFYDKEAGLVTYTDYNNVMKMPIDARLIDLNGKTEIIENSMKLINGNVYVPWNFVKSKLNVTIKESPYLHVLMVNTYKDTIFTGKIGGETPLYGSNEGDLQPFATLNKGEQVRVLIGEQGESQLMKVVVEDGLTGYVDQGAIVEQVADKGPEPMKTPPVRDDQIVMGWHQVFNRTASARTDKLEVAKGLEVVSPTWFAFANDLGDIKSIANIDYVKWAHSKGIEVWALVNDFSSDKNVDEAIFTDPNKRQYVIDQLLRLSKDYNLDGINIDFEKVPKEVGPYFVQFMRELAPQLRRAGVVSSVDVYVPSAWTAHYRRDILGEFVDYVIIMGYDEHWGGGPESGSVSSIGFVETAIRKTLEVVPKEKVILGVPYYTRLWQEKTVSEGQMKLSSKAYGMESAFNNLQKNGAEIKWLAEVGQFYGEYIKNQSLYRVWLEDERSMEGRLKKASEYQLAGVAAWKLGLEKESIWPLMNKYMK